MSKAASDPHPAPATPAKGRGRALRRLLLAALVLALLPSIALVRYGNSPGPLTGPPRTVEISRGEGLRSIARALERRRIISKPLLFVALALARGTEGSLKAGEYEFEAGATPLGVLKTLEAGRPKAHFVTLKEGWTISEMAQAIGNAGIASPEGLLALARNPAFARSLGIPQATLEGYCFPDTYALTRPTSEEAIIRHLVSRFNEVLRAEKQAAGDSGGGAGGSDAPLSDHEIVTLASIVEKETGLPEERPLIAAVFLNRLRKGMRLQSDPTVIYGIPDFDGNLTRRHHETSTPYNTYTEIGLPPGPIANPGRAALRAVLSPAPAEYLYFVSRNDGSHHFSRTLDEHNHAVRLYQKRGGRNRVPGPESPS